jgi:hypothetical protein
MIRTGEIHPGTLLWRDGMVEWQPARGFWIEITGVPAPPSAPSMKIPPPPLPAGLRPRVRAPQSTVRKSGCWRLATMNAWPPLILFVVITLGYSLYVSIRDQVPPSAAASALTAAEQEMTRGGESGYGSSSAAVAAAAQMASLAAEFRYSTIEQISGTRRGLVSKLAKAGDYRGFRAYCKVKGEEVVFLLMVPDLRNFANDAKIQMAENAWMAAVISMNRFAEPRPKTIVVVTKGQLNYDRMLVGASPSPKELQEMLEDESAVVIHQGGVKKTISGDPSQIQARLLGFFETVNPPAKTL